jgi:hypothetical protein
MSRIRVPRAIFDSELRDSVYVHALPFAFRRQSFAALPRELVRKNMVRVTFPPDNVWAHFSVKTVIITGNLSFVPDCVLQEVGSAGHE